MRFDLSPQFLWDLYLKQNGKCAISGEKINFTKRTNSSKYSYENTASLDRIDSSIGYLESNVQWVHKDINRMKWQFDQDHFVERCRQCAKNSFLNSKRPSFHEYFLQLAFFISLRSDDKFVKHGAILVDNKTKHIIGTGYNGTFRSCDVKKTEPNNRENRRKWMIHAEENMITNSSKNPLDLPEGATAYITGTPCVQCLQRMINFGIKTIYYQNDLGTITENEETEDFRKKILEMNPELVVEKIESNWLL